VKEFTGQKQSVDGHDFWTTEYVKWLELQVSGLRSENANLRKELAALRHKQWEWVRMAQRQSRYEQDYLPYPDEEYDR